MIELKIGTWVRREYDTKQYAQTKAHRVESVVADAAITRCGRRMEQHTNALVPNRLVQVVPLNPEMRCRACSY